MIDLNQNINGCLTAIQASLEIEIAQHLDVSFIERLNRALPGYYDDVGTLDERLCVYCRTAMLQMLLRKER